jgi:hypothetical protein
MLLRVADFTRHHFSRVGVEAEATNHLGAAAAPRPLYTPFISRAVITMVSPLSIRGKKEFDLEEEAAVVTSC